MREWIKAVTVSLLVFIATGMLIKWSTSPDPKVIYVHPSEVDWIAVQSWLDSRRTPALTKRAETKRRINHAWHLTPKRVKWWIKASMGSVLVILLYLFIWFRYLKPITQERKS